MTLPWIGTSWKMNKLRAQAQDYAAAIAASHVAHTQKVQPFLIPPFPYIADVARALLGTQVKIGAQNMHWCDAGAWTGEISPPMIQDCGATMVELGHSERRTHFGETDTTVALKVKAAVDHGLLALVCIGDTREDYNAGRTADALAIQVRAALSLVGQAVRDKIIFAYEPVWSIGEGGIPADPDFANRQHMMIKSLCAEITGDTLNVVYGGSVNSGNCADLIRQPAIDGLFIGRAAWEASGYIDIVDRVIKALE